MDSSFSSVIGAVFLDAILSLAPAAAQSTTAGAPAAPVAESPAQREARLAWWREAKFGMFVHWGVYSMAGGEWKGSTNHAEWLQFTAKIPLAEYTKLAEQFNPRKFDAEAWVKVAKDAGMKYLVITSKHHDGFAIYDSPSNPYNIVKTSVYHHDPLKDLAAACHREGLKFCVYYSLGRDWHDPDVPTGSPGNAKFPPGSRSNLIDYPDETKKDFAKYFERKVKPQVRELLTQYGPIGIMWFDTPEHTTKAQSAELLALIHGLQPDCIVNARVGNGLGDYGTPEQEIPAKGDTKPWETCMTLNRHWGYNKADQDWKPTRTLLLNLIDIVSKGGNYLLNVGPTGEGLIPQPSVDRLAEMGHWLRTNGEAVYGCGPTAFGQEFGKFSETEKDGQGKPKRVAEAASWRCTTKPGRIFIHVFQWPEGKLELPPLTNKISKAYLLADPARAPLSIDQTATGISIRLPASAPDALATVICLESSKE